MKKITKNKDQYLAECPCCNHPLKLRGIKDDSPIFPDGYELVPDQEQDRPPAERPPEKGDWIVITRMNEWLKNPDQPFKVTDYDPKSRWVFIYMRKIDAIGDSVWKDDSHFSISNHRIVRRAADPLRVGDKVAFGSVGSTEGWIYAKSDGIGAEDEFTFLHINLDSNGTPVLRDNVAHMREESVTLVAPHVEPAEKGDC